MPKPVTPAMVPLVMVAEFKAALRAVALSTTPGENGVNANAVEEVSKNNSPEIIAVIRFENNMSCSL